jgi:hypothetical protein
MISANAAMTGSYDYSEVARSVWIAIAASYAALDLAGRVTAASGRIRLAWLGCGAAAMGIGIWRCTLRGCWPSTCLYPSSTSRRQLPDGHPRVRGRSVCSEPPAHGAG